MNKKPFKYRCGEYLFQKSTHKIWVIKHKRRDKFPLAPNRYYLTIYGKGTVGFTEIELDKDFIKTENPQMAKVFYGNITE